MSPVACYESISQRKIPSGTRHLLRINASILQWCHVPGGVFGAAVDDDLLVFVEFDEDDPADAFSFGLFRQWPGTARFPVNFGRTPIMLGWVGR